MTSNEVPPHGAQLAVLRAFERPDEVREFERGRFEIVRVGAAIFSVHRTTQLKECRRDPFCGIQPSTPEWTQ